MKTTLDRLDKRVSELEIEVRKLRVIQQAQSDATLRFVSFCLNADEKKEEALLERFEEIKQSALATLCLMLYDSQVSEKTKPKNPVILRIVDDLMPREILDTYRR